MKRKLRIVTVCAVGVGSSLMLKFNAREVLEKNGIQADFSNADMTTVKGVEADVVLTTPDLVHALEGAKQFRRIVVLENMVSKKETEEKLVPACREVMAELEAEGK
jgi:PTS system ascorbate-specific IIB component